METMPLPRNVCQSNMHLIDFLGQPHVKIDAAPLLPYSNPRRTKFPSSENDFGIGRDVNTYGIGAVVEDNAEAVPPFLYYSLREILYLHTGLGIEPAEHIFLKSGIVGVGCNVGYCALAQLAMGDGCASLVELVSLAGPDFG